MNQLKVSIVIVNWNGLMDTTECLESLQKIDYPNYEVVVVDNGSDGNDVQMLQNRFGDYIHLIRNDRNYGGCGGYNIGVRYVLENSNADYILILDNDTVVIPEFLTEMVEVFKADSSIGIASAIIYYYDIPDQFVFWWEKIDLWKLDMVMTLGLIVDVIKRKVFGMNGISRGLSDSVKEVEGVCFWCALFKRKCIETVGSFVEEYRGFETIDYSIRSRKSGYKIVQVPKAKVWHKFRSAKRIDGVFQYYGCRGLFRFMKKHATKWQYRCFLFQFFSVHLWLATIYYLVWHHRPRAFWGFCKGVRDGLFNDKELWQGLKRFLAVPLYRNALYLIVNTVVVGLLSFLFWIVVARFYTEVDVGYSSAIISVATLLTTLSLFGFNVSIIRFLHKTEKPQELINSCLILCGVVSIVLAGIFLVSVDFWSPSLAFIKDNAIYSVTFIILTLILTLSGIVCSVFVARRRAGFVLCHNAISSLTKILLPLLLVLFFSSFGIIASWGVASGIALVVSLFVFVPKAQSQYKFLPVLKFNLIKDIWRYSGGNYLAYIFMVIPFLVLPVIVTNLLGAEQNAYFYIAWMIATLISAIPNGIALSLFAEGSHFEDKLRETTLKSLKFTFMLLIPSVILLILVGKWLLLTFGQSYSINALHLLWVLAVSSLPLSITLIYSSILQVTNRIKELMVIWCFVATVMVVVSYLVIPTMGIMGIGYVWLGVHCIVTIYVVASSRRSLVTRNVAGILIHSKEVS